GQHGGPCRLSLTGPTRPTFVLPRLLELVGPIEQYHRLVERGIRGLALGHGAHSRPGSACPRPRGVCCRGTEAGRRGSAAVPVAWNSTARTRGLGRSAGRQVGGGEGDGEACNLVIGVRRATTGRRRRLASS